MSGIIQPIDIRTAGCVKSSVGRAQKSFSELEPETLSLFGESSLTLEETKELIALFSETKAQSKPLTLSDRLTKSLISAGLVKGITPMSVRRKLGAVIPDFALRLPDGSLVEQHKAGCTFSKG